MKMEEVTDRRTVDQNSKLWPMLRDISKQVEWVVDGQATYMNEWDWKDVLTAALKKSQRVAKGIEGGWVMLGCHTSNMKKSEMAELIELAQMFGDSKEVNWSVEE